MTSRWLLHGCAVLVVLWCGALPVAAQVDRATLTGTVRDSSDAVVPKATVTVTQLATNVVTKATTNAEGAYLVVNLAPGQYLVEAEASGMAKVPQSIVLEVGQRARLDFTLSVGGIAEAVTVSAVSPLLDTETPVVGSVINQSEVAKLPLAIRNWDDLLAMVAGVQGDRYTEETGTTASGRTGGVNVHGNRSLQNNFLLDGVDNNSISTNVQELSTQVSRPSIDAINEFKVVTSPYAAEYGRAPGAAISVTTKSGTNAFRGTAYEYYRNDRFDSNTFFARRANQPKAANDQNQFGGNLGGPIVRNRAFFFGDFEGTRIKKGVIRLTRVPTDLERQGIFSGTIRDPQNAGQPFLNNTIPLQRFDPVARAILELIPRANQSGTNNFFRQPNVQDDGERYLGRVDFRASADDTFFARYIYTDRFRYVPGFLGGIVDGTSTSAWGRNYLNSHGLVGGWTKILGPTLINEFRFSWARGVNDGTQDPFGQNGLPQIGFKGIPDDPRILGGIVGVNITGYSRLGSPNFMPKFQHTDTFEYLDTITWLRGDHQLKFGADIMAPMRNEYLDVPATRGDLSFTVQFTGNALADFLLGYVQRAVLSNVFVVNQRHWSTAFFVQDDWKPNDRLTLTLGLRYDFMTPPYETDNHIANFDPAKGALVSATDGSLADRALVEPDKNNFAPRVGLVYKWDDKTILRGGYGVFFNPLERIGSEDQLALNPPGLRNIDIQVAGSATTPVFFMRDGFPANFLDPSNIVLSRLLVRTADRHAPNFMLQQFGGGIERQFGQAFVGSVDVTGSIGRNQAVLRNLNQPLPGTQDANGPLPYPNFGHIQWREMVGDSSFKGMDLSLEKRFANGYGYRASYTLSKSIDQAPEHLSASSGRPQNGRDLKSWEGPSDFDIRHRFVGNFIAELPFGEGKRWATAGPASAILGGWLVSGIYTARSGRPFTVTQGNNNVGAGATGLPDRTGDPKGQETVDNWFNVAAFTRVVSGKFGNAGRNLYRGPGFATFDMSVQRRVAVREHVGVTLRWDVFNLFNRANFGNPVSDITAATAGTIQSLAGDPRIMQFALRLEF